MQPEENQKEKKSYGYFNHVRIIVIKLLLFNKDIE